MKNLKEKNKLIHEFLGYKWIEKGMFQPDYLHDEPMTFWEAVEKIVRYEYEDGVTAFFRTFGIRNAGTDQYMVRINRQRLFEADTLKEALFEAVADFVRWYKYNKNNKK